MLLFGRLARKMANGLRHYSIRPQIIIAECSSIWFATHPTYIANGVNSCAVGCYNYPNYGCTGQLAA
jgi:hypothetical protein